MRGTPLDHSCGRVAKLALDRRRVQQRCPRAPIPEPGKGRRPKNRQSQRRNVFSALVSCLLPVLGCLFRGFPGSGSLVLRSCPFGFLFALVPPHVFFLLAAGVTFQLPAGGRSGQAQGHRPKNWYRAPTQGPAFTGIPLRTTLLCTSVPCRACLALPLPLCYFIFRVCVSRLFHLPLSLVVTVDAKRLHCADVSVGGFYEISLQCTLSCTFLDARRTCHTQCPSTKVTLCITPSFVWLAVIFQCFS